MIYKLELTMFIIFIIMFSVLIRNLSMRRKYDKENRLYASFMTLCKLFLIYLVGLTLQIIYLNCNVKGNLVIYFDYIVYLGAAYMPISFFKISKLFENNNADFKKYKWMYYFATILLIILWTNDLHSLFYKKYSIYFSSTEFGPALVVFSVYSYAMYVYSMFKIVKCSKNKSGMFTMQSFLIILGILVPLLGNFIGIVGIANTTIYLQAILFSITLAVNACVKSTIPNAHETI